MREHLAIRTDALTLRYGAKTAVSEVALEVARGEIYGFLGPNGAGKTSVIMLLLGLLRPSAGSVEVLGDPRGAGSAALRCRIGAVQEKPFLYPEFSGREYLALFAQLYGMKDARWRVAYLLGLLGLDAVADRRLATYSRGMQQKICFARALVHDPELLILDEPAAGLDPHGLKELRDILATLRGQGKTVFLSSHHLSENEKICDRIGVMSGGRLVHQGSLGQTMRQLGQSPLYEVETAPGAGVSTEALNRLDFIRSAVRAGALLEVELESDLPDARASIVAAVTGLGGTVLMVRRKQASLESIFLAMTSKAAP
jgi:ABC-2 type transport system ATP-binding protein